MRVAPLAIFAGLAVAVPACGALLLDPALPGDDPAGDDPAAEEAAHDDAAGGAQRAHDGSGDARDRALGSTCDDRVHGFRIAHPDGWRTNPGEVTPPCTVFDPDPPRLEPHTELPLDAAVTVLAEDRDLDAVLRATKDDPATDVHAVETTEVAGRDALLVDGEATGEAYLPAGTTVHRIHVAWGDGTVTAHVNGLAGPDVDARRDVAVDMLGTLEPIEATEAPDPDRPAIIAEPLPLPRSGGATAADDAGHGPPARLVDVRLAAHAAFDRLVLQFEERVPPFEVAWAERPVHAQPGHEEVTLRGDAAIEVALAATGVDRSQDEPVRTYEGPQRLDGGAAPVLEVVVLGDHHGEMTWAVGLDGDRDVAVGVLEDPARLVIDVETDRRRDATTS